MSLVVERPALVQTVGQKIRFKTWYWGQYVKFTGRQYVDQNGQPFPHLQIDLAQMEPYIEALHGVDQATRKDVAAHRGPDPEYRDIILERAEGDPQSNQLFEVPDA